MQKNHIVAKQNISLNIYRVNDIIMEAVMITIIISFFK